MKIGIFDSGLGGLIVADSLISRLPQYSYVYLGDTARVPYGNRSGTAVFGFAVEALDYLLAQDCGLVIMACNTASAEALRKLQQEYLPERYPDRKVLGVLVPTAEAAVNSSKSGRIGVLATTGTVNSQTYVREIEKLRPEARVFQNAAPLLVPLIENRGLKWAKPILAEYLAPLLNNQIDTLILGCTHYPILKSLTADIAGPGVTIISQDAVVPYKLQDYLTRHPEIERRLDRDKQRRFAVTDLSPTYQALADEMFEQKLKLVKVELN